MEASGLRPPGHEGPDVSTLSHREIHTDPSRIGVSLSLGDELGPLGGGAGFALVEDPRETARALIMGMFVLRPAVVPWAAPLAGDVDAALRAGRDWCANVRGVDGGGFLADGDPLDAYRLALGYGLCDAVIVGRDTVIAEGVDRGDAPGYVWQPWVPASWPQLADLDDDLEARIARVRRAWQAEGVLSPRRFPAQVVVSRSGTGRPGEIDLLEARVFSAMHPDGSPVETVVLTSETGAGRLRARAPHLEPLLLVASPPGDPDGLDLAAVPRLLRERLDVRLAQHDGGRTLLSAFSAAGALPQLNLTLMRGRSVRALLAASDRLDATTRTALLDDFEARRALFFSGDHALPAALAPASVLRGQGEAVVATLDARGLRGL
jgi:hypothetical protein